MNKKGWLILDRKIDSNLYITNEITKEKLTINIANIEDYKVKLAISAPGTYSILREEANCRFNKKQ